MYMNIIFERNYDMRHGEIDKNRFAQLKKKKKTN